jgi:hypothetical protein
MRIVARSKVSSPTALMEDSLTTSGKGKERERSRSEAEPFQDKKEEGGMLRRLESKVGFRRSSRPVNPPLSPTSLSPTLDRKHDDERIAGFTSFITPSLRQASMSSPTLHLSSQTPSSPQQQSAIASPPSAQKPRRLSMQPPPKNSFTSIHDSLSPPRIKSAMKHRASQSQPMNNPSSPSATNLARSSSPNTSEAGHLETTARNMTSLPVTAISSGSGASLTRSRSQSQTPLPISSPVRLMPTGSSPISPRFPPRSRVLVPTPGRLASSSTSHLPITNSPTPVRRTSLDVQRRPSIDSPSPRRATKKVSLDLRGTGAGAAGDDVPLHSPVRLRPTSPAQRSYAQNRHFNISSGSLAALVSPSSSSSSQTEQQKVIREATVMLCKEVKKPPEHISHAEWEAVDTRMQNLARMERLRDRVEFPSSSIEPSSSEPAGLGLEVAREERERQVFAEALRDGYVLCQ